MGGLFSKTFNPEKDVPDLTGKVIIVTGGKYVHFRDDVTVVSFFV